jgi:hypothetical protein
MIFNDGQGVINNILVLGVLVLFGYMIFLKFKGKEFEFHFDIDKFTKYYKK